MSLAKNKQMFSLKNFIFNANVMTLYVAIMSIFMKYVCTIIYTHIRCALKGTLYGLLVLL